MRAIMGKVTLSDVNVAVNKAFAAGLAGQAYEGLMPSAHDAGTHYRQAYPDPQDAGQEYLAIILAAAGDGFNDGSNSGTDRTSFYTQTTGPTLASLGAQDMKAVYAEGYQAGKASFESPNWWIPWAVGAGAVAVLGVGALVLTSHKENPAKGKGPRQLHPEGAEIVDNMAKVVWADRWAVREEEKGVSFSGVDVFYAAPPTPPEAQKWALKQARKLAEMNGLDPRKPYEAMEELYARAVAANDAAGRRSQPAHRFGSDLGLMITGHGVSWFDDNAKFDLKKPYDEFYI